MKRASLAGLVVACGLSLAACGGDDEGAVATATTATVATVPAPQEVDVPVPVSLPPAERRRFVAGRGVASRSGCLACHRIGAAGSDSPGTNLAGIGARRSRAQLRRALVDPQVAMPAYDELPAGELDALVTFLSALGDATCPDGSDCG